MTEKAEKEKKSMNGGFLSVNRLYCGYKRSLFLLNYRIYINRQATK